MFAWFKSVDSACGQVLPAYVRLGLYGLVAGGVSMLVYRRLSPQRRLAALKQEVGDARRALRAYDGTDGREVLRLSRRAVGLSLRQLLLVAGPTAVAAAPVVLAMACVGSAYESAGTWLRSWELPFMAGATVAALGLKFGLKIV